ncbi:NACHT, LRR and PYD domains-containing protein 3-like [Salminus brasiliensis]|uniref:NACHT, LRR and PYD domains-containing protein 3-like n=1 Tax=Salminus brasiliensis TaxID=930266 RepID=UPI003B82E8A5
MKSETVLRTILKKLEKGDLNTFRNILCMSPPEGYRRIPAAKVEQKEPTDLAKIMVDVYEEGPVLKVAALILRKMQQNNLATKLEQQVREQRQKTNPDDREQPSKKPRLSGVLEACPSTNEEDSKSNKRKDPQSAAVKHKLWLKNKTTFIVEGTSRERKKIPLNDIYTTLTVTEGQSKVINNEHEVLDTDSLKRSEETAISCNNIFSENNREIRTVLMKGVAGSGKTVSVQKFILDWAEDKANTDIKFLFVLPFRELNLFEKETPSLHELLGRLHPELKGWDSDLYTDEKILFIFDGLEESRISLNFRKAAVVSDVHTTSTVGSLVINLINQKLLPSALIWITSRPAAASLVPSEHIDRVIEIQGFSDHQKEEYFRKRVQNKDQADRIISHIKETQSLHIMCHIPVFCWISVTVFQPWLNQNCSETIPTTLTEMYSHFLLIQTNTKNQKFDEKHEEDTKKLLENNRGIILKLAELAFKQLLKGNVMFYEADLKECSIDVKEASLYSGLCTEIFKTESFFFREKIYCFVHLSFQEFFAALYVFYCYLSKKTEEIKMFQPKTRSTSREIPLDVLMKHAVDEALRSKNGHLDLFLRFLHGITLESSQRLLKGLLPHMYSSSESIQKMKQNLKRGQKKNINPERWINLSHCLIEMKDNSLQQEIQAFLNSKKKSKKLSLAHCSAMANMFQASEERIEELDLKQYNTTEEGRRRLIPAVRNCRKAILSDCDLTLQSCENIASALQSANSHLRELDLSNNSLQDSGMKQLCDGLKSSQCKLEMLSLSGCKLTASSCTIIASVLSSPNSSLTKLDLSYNDQLYIGMKTLSAGLKSSHCKLEMLRLSNCKLPGKSCEHIASALNAAKSVLKELDLSCNDLQDSGIKLISGGLKSRHCNLNILRLSECNLTGLSCKDIASVLEKANSSLRELDLSNNDLQDSGVAFLSVGLKTSDCSLEILRLSGCCISELGCSSLVSALRLNPNHLRELDMSYNHPGNLGAKQLRGLKNDAGYKLNILQLDYSGETRMAPGLKKYACRVTLDLDTANVHLALSEGNKTITLVEEEEIYDDDKQRFKRARQVMCEESLSGRCYWEADWIQGAVIAVTCEGISRKGSRSDCLFGRSKKSWSLSLSEEGCSAWHNNKSTRITPAIFSSSRKVGVFLNCPAGTLTFYSISSDQHKLTHIHTFCSSFTEPLFAGFGLEKPGSSVSLKCWVENSGIYKLDFCPVC